MSDLLELSAQYRETGLACRVSLREQKRKLGEAGSLTQELELKQRITMLTAMSRDCIAISNYLKDYYERRKRHGQEGFQTSGK